MNAVETRATAPAITICNGLATVLTTNVAGVFQKAHKDVLEAVETIIQRAPEDRRGNFIPVELERPSNLGKGIVKYKAYALTKAGFTFLAMGFTGEKADKFKWAYIDEFDRMEKALSGEGGPDYIDEAQQREIQRAVGRRAAGIGKNFSLIYGALKDRFDIPRYTCLQKRDFEAALDFIQKAPIMSREQWLQKEESERKRIEATTYRDERIPERIPAFYLTDAEAKNLLAGIYCLRYLFRPQIQAFYNTLNQMKSPLAAQFYEFFTCMHLYFIENDLSKHGYRMEDLPCYRHWLAHQPA
ncbi:Rha family transcriptional regulator [Sutterella wadsworthensis]|uniref:Rha family transcriptional regulator n=1 Tax=Sutterella wadsworthensis TaxID=40545 RepID=UPI002673CDCA|nr:Rha family transcriptional regulator [Sutterella wadsworthensis]